jgi:hypothetical protein
VAQIKDFAGEPAGSIFSDGKKTFIGENKKKDTFYVRSDSRDGLN